MEEKKKNAPSNVQNLMTGIVTKTILRNTNDSKEEFLSKLGASVDLDEDKVIRGMIFNALTEITKQLLSIEIAVNQSTGIMTLLLTEDEKEKLETKGE